MTGMLAVEARDLERAPQLLRSALEHALAAGHVTAAAAAAAEHLFLVSQVLTRGDDTTIFLAMTRGLREQIGGDRRLDHRIAVYLANAYIRRAEYAAATIEADRILSLARGLEDSPGLGTALGLMLRGLVAAHTGHLTEAVSDLRHSLEITRTAVGDQHPKVAVARFNLALALRRAGDVEGSLEQLRLARARFVADNDPLYTIHCDHHIARALQDQGKLDEALAGYRAVLAAGEQLVGPDAGDLSYPITGIGAVLRRQGKLDEAEAALRRALALRERWFPENSPVTAETLAELGLVELEQGRIRAAHADLTRVLEICSHSYCEDVDLAEVRAATTRAASDTP